MEIEMVLNDVEVFFLKRALQWRIQNIDYFIEKKQLEGLKKANQLSEKATLQGILNFLNEQEKVASEEPVTEEAETTETVVEEP